MKKITVDGNEACANISYMFTEIAGIYPITPSSPMAEHIDEWSKDRLNIFNDHVKVIEMQSEAGAAGMVHGSLRAGCYTSTYTASQGLLLMIPNMYKIAGEMLPCVMHVASRSLATHALSIFGDHQDVYAARDTGFCMLASSSVQDCSNLAAVSHLSAISSSLPFLHFFDGFRTSHEINKIDALELDDLKPLVDLKKIEEFRNKALNPLKPYTVGTAENDDVYFQGIESRNKNYNSAINIVEYYMQKINEITNSNYKPFNYYGSPKAKKVIIAMGSVCETIKETIDSLNDKVGLIEVHLYRPFSAKHLLSVLPKTVTKIAVIDRSKSQGSQEPLYQDVCSVLKDSKITIVGGRYGLSSKNTNPSCIKAIYDMLDKPINNFTVGINDDVTNLSLKLEDIKTSNSFEILIYGYGSDGMVSASKSFMKLIGNNTDKYVQGYFQYDSKKSGGVTKCHLRFNDNIIRSTYYVENPKITVVTKDTYLKKFDCISNLSKNGIFILNTEYNNQQVYENIDGKILKYIKDNNITFYKINAYKIANELGIPNKISTIMESILANLTNLIDYEKAKEIMKEYAKNRYFKKGEEVLNANYKAIDESINYLQKVELDEKQFIEKEDYKYKTLFEKIEHRLGDELKVSEVNNDGIYESGTSILEKRNISNIIPKWINSNCIKCNMCSLYCPHGVIRPYLINEEEYQKLPDNIKELCKKEGENYFVIAISALNCTGCGVCVKTCPGLKGEKAIEMKEMSLENKLINQEIFDYLENNITSKNLYPNTIVKGLQFNKPKFAYSGACAGCGETAYIKLLTQLFGNSLMIANATGCSSIYGASAPVTPYTIPWANSLFEDNAEFGYGIKIANDKIRNRIKNVLEKSSDPYAIKWVNNMNDYDICKEVYDNIKLPDDLKDLKDYLMPRTLLCVGGDGWAYDIGYSGIDHVLASGDNVNILVLDTQVYSNTGGQASKASPKGAIAAFASNGKKNTQKDLAKMALAYSNCYVAQVSLGMNPNNVIKVIKDAINYDGPSIIIAYSPCISHGINGGLINSVEMEKMAVECGFYPIFHYDPKEGFKLDYKDVNFDLYEDFLNKQTRFKMLYKINSEHANDLIKSQKEDAINRFNYYKNLDEK